MKELNQKLAQIQTELKTKKSSYNSFGKYYFRKAEDILEATKPFLLKHGVSVTLNEEMIATDPVPTIKSTATISDGKNVGRWHQRHRFRSMCQSSTSRLRADRKTPFGTAPSSALRQKSAHPVEPQRARLARSQRRRQASSRKARRPSVTLQHRLSTFRS